MVEGTTVGVSILCIPMIRAHPLIQTLMRTKNNNRTHAYLVNNNACSLNVPGAFCGSTTHAYSLGLLGILLLVQSYIVRTQLYTVKTQRLSHDPSHKFTQRIKTTGLTYYTENQECFHCRSERVQDSQYPAGKASAKTLCSVLFTEAVEKSPAPSADDIFMSRSLIRMNVAGDGWILSPPPGVDFGRLSSRSLVRHTFRVWGMAQAGWRGCWWCACQYGGRRVLTGQADIACAKPLSAVRESASRLKGG